MGLLDKLFNQKEPRRPDPQESSQFREVQESTSHEEEEGDDGSARSTPRRDLVQVVLRETMRKHGIPSDWIECRILSVMSKSRGQGMHLLLVVRQGDDRLVTYVHAFQDAFLRELATFDRRARESVFSLSWQFEGKGHVEKSPMPGPGSWESGKPAEAAPLAAAMSAAAAAEDTSENDELQEDLQALFAIRDAALKQDAPPPALADRDRPDFEPTRPGET
jgi:hypothetical protein